MAWWRSSHALPGYNGMSLGVGECARSPDSRGDKKTPKKKKKKPFENHEPVKTDIFPA